MQDKATALAVIGPATLPPAIIEAELHRASDYARASRSKGTLAAYESDWPSFVARGLGALPASPKACAGYLASEAERHMNASTIGRRCAAHSTRAGWTTSAAVRGANLWRMAYHTRHKSLETLRL